MFVIHMSQTWILIAATLAVVISAVVTLSLLLSGKKKAYVSDVPAPPRSAETSPGAPGAPVAPVPSSNGASISDAPAQNKHKPRPRIDDNLESVLTTQKLAMPAEITIDVIEDILTVTTNDTRSDMILDGSIRPVTMDKGQIHMLGFDEATNSFYKVTDVKRTVVKGWLHLYTVIDHNRRTYALTKMQDVATGNQYEYDIDKGQFRAWVTSPPDGIGETRLCEPSPPKPEHVFSYDDDNLYLNGVRVTGRRNTTVYFRYDNDSGMLKYGVAAVLNDESWFVNEDGDYVIERGTSRDLVDEHDGVLAIWSDLNRYNINGGFFFVDLDNNVITELRYADTTKKVPSYSRGDCTMKVRFLYDVNKGKFEKWVLKE